MVRISKKVSMVDNEDFLRMYTCNATEWFLLPSTYRWSSIGVFTLFWILIPCFVILHIIDYLMAFSTMMFSSLYMLRVIKRMLRELNGLIIWKIIEGSFKIFVTACNWREEREREKRKPTSRYRPMFHCTVHFVFLFSKTHRTLM